MRELFDTSQYSSPIERSLEYHQPEELADSLCNLSLNEKFRSGDHVQRGPNGVKGRVLKSNTRSVYIEWHSDKGFFTTNHSQSELDLLMVRVIPPPPPTTNSPPPVPPQTRGDSKMSISFGATVDALLRMGKTATRRAWADKHAAKFVKCYEEGLRVKALNLDFRYGGKQIGWLTLTHRPRKERLVEMLKNPVAEMIAEGLPHLSFTGLTQVRYM